MEKYIEIKSALLICLLFALSWSLNGQVGIDNPNPNAKSSIDLGADNKGLLLNRMTTLKRTTVLGPSLTASEKGMVVFDTDLEQIFLWDGTSWETVTSGAIGGSGNQGEITIWGPANVLGSDGNLFWDGTYKRLGIGTQLPTAGLSIHSAADIALDIRNNRTNPISEHIVGIERTNNPVTGSDLLNLKVPTGSPSDFQFLECEYGTSKVLKINGDGHINATSLGFGTDDPLARLTISDGSWDVKMNVVATSNPSVIPHMINFEKTVDPPYSGTTILRMAQPASSPEGANYLDVLSGSSSKLIINGNGDLITKLGANVVAQSGYLEVQTSAGERRVFHAQSTSGGYTNYYNTEGTRTLYLRSGTTGSTAGGEISAYNSSGIETVFIDANDGSGAVMRLRDGSGNTTITLDGDHSSTGDSRITVDELKLNGGSDFAEMFDIVDENDVEENILPGMVVSIDPRIPGRLKVCNEAYDKKVAGIISGAGGVKPGLMMGDDRTLASGDYPVALSGRVYVKATNINGEIQPGDFLTTSRLNGYAMKVKDLKKARGAIIGKAMTGLEEREGLVLVLVSLQ